MESDRLFPLISQDNPVAPPSPQHLIVSVYGEVLTLVQIILLVELILTSLLLLELKLQQMIVQQLTLHT